MISNISIVWLLDHSLTHLLSYPHSRDAIASKNFTFSVPSNRDYTYTDVVLFDCLLACLSQKIFSLTLSIVNQLFQIKA